ncbi:hypothetical protein AB3N61_18645 [Leptospira sp. WS58.C1]|uniref:hypothetical protein n=1 Tax=Leptospira cinconiae TaxID=3235173 RepID=UPI00349E563F
MLSLFAKIIFVLTSLAPVLVSFGVSQKMSPFEKLTLISSAVLLFFIAWITLVYIQANGEIEPINIESLKNADQEVLAFLVTYLVPFLASVEFSNALIIYLIIFVAIFNSNSYHFNPLLGIIGYHFYQIETNTKVSYILITKRKIRNMKSINKVVHITDYLVMDKEEK